MTKKKQILLVDDEEKLTQMMSMLLQTRGYDVTIATTAAETLEKVNSDIDLIILDLVLPDCNGFEICRKLKQQKQTRHIPIIMLSAHSIHEDRVEALYLGADDFLSKPCEHEELFARMEAVMRRGKFKQGGEMTVSQKETICDLRRILDESLIIPYFQPIYMCDPVRLLGVEILTRPTIQGVLANPETFFKAALQYGLYTEMEILSWSMALGYASRHLKDAKIFLNCNPYFIESAQFSRVKSIFERNTIKAQNVILEITERSAISDFKLFYNRLHEFRDYGFRFAVDDVGGGYASLEAIVETKPEVVKIDRHIVKSLKTDAFKRSIVKFVVSFCEENGIISVAEGIEVPEDLEAVRELGVDACQGYYLCKPTPHIDLDAFQSVSF